MNYPKQIKARRKIDALTGIKSSLDHIRSVIALVYLLYVTNGRKPFVRYSIPDGTKIKIEPDLLREIEVFLGRVKLEDIINGNPLITNQYEPLYVGVTLLMKLGYLKMEGKQNTAERTGGFRYPKQLCFANNTMVLDLILKGIPENVRKESLFDWLYNREAENADFEERVGMFITTCTCFTQFKLRDNTNSELFFQTEGIYKALTEGDGDVVYSDSHEFVGPTRIYNNVLKEGLEPWIGMNRSVLNVKGGVNPDADSVSQMLSTTLDIYNVKDDSLLGESTDSKEDVSTSLPNEYPLQQIYYGAPGTGKSHEIKDKTKGESVIRTTFHPDSDYSTFVGAYKPTMDDVDAKVVPVVLGESGTVFNKNEGTYKEKRIVYQFVMQAFLKAYLGAWKKFAEADGSEVKPQFLVIEEINRGNCAQIFGDLFQLLDRGKSGFSEYPIEADNDLRQEIERAFKEHKDYKLKEGVKINAEGVVEDYTSNYGATLSEDIQSGRVLLLPSNLYIWATMNTSDQSLFPIDSAFKRRWEWKYIPIDTRKEQWSIVAEGMNYSWTSFLDIVNERVFKATSSEDKQLGFYFCKAQNNVVSAETFVSKVLFYLWNDVFKDYEEAESIFRDSEGKQLPFSRFYNTNGSVNEAMVTKLLVALKVEYDKDDQQASMDEESIAESV